MSGETGMSGMYGERNARLAAELRRLRRASGNSAAAFGPLLGLSQSSVSRYETGRLTPTVALVQRWTKVAEAPPELTSELVAIAQDLSTEVNPWRLVHRDSFAGHQQEIRDLEARTRLVRVYQPATIPGLLQIPDYTRHLLQRLPGVHVPEAALPAAIASRMERQTALYDASRRFEFVITETALRSRICPDTVLHAQWDRLLAFMTLGNVDIRIIPIEVELPVVASTSFVLFDGELVIVESLTAESVVRDQHDIAIYTQTFERLLDVAWADGDARNVLDQLIHTESPTGTNVIGKVQPVIAPEATVKT